MTITQDPFGFHAAINWDVVDTLSEAQISVLFEGDVYETCRNCFEPIRFRAIGEGAEPTWLTDDEDHPSACEYSVKGSHEPGTAD